MRSKPANRHLRTAALALGMGAAIVLAAVPAAHAAISPPSFEGILKPGESATLTKTVDAPDVPRSMDLMLVVDLTGSYSDDLPRIKSLAPGIFDAVRARSSDSRFGLITFVDFPFGPWGSSASEYAYRIDQQPTADKATWVAAVNNMRSMIGNDEPESQYEALYQGATGAGRQMPNTTDGDYTDRGEIAPGQDAQLRGSAARVFAITTDSSFHNAGDPGGPFPYPGASRNATVDALKFQKIKVVAIKAPGSTTQMDDVATNTGGTVTFTNRTSDEIGSAITTGIEDLTFRINGAPEGCEPLVVTLDPPGRPDTPAGAAVTFTETISLPEGLPASAFPAGGVVECRVRFRANGAAFGVQTIRVVVNRSPDCSGVQATPNSLSPPNHSLREVGLAGATDPDGDALTLSIDRVTQDEPPDGLGDGDTTPDAQAGPTSSSILLRAERSGRDDGRVYVIHFQVTDGRGGSCTGTTQVSVPKGAKAPVDSGQSFEVFGS